MNIRILIVGLLLAAAAGCASGGGGSGATVSRSVITADEALATNQTNAYDVVRARRPTWLRKRGVRSLRVPGEIAVYVDGVRMGGLEALREVHVSAIGEIRHYDAASATQRWGTGHEFGVIHVSTRY